MKKVLSVIALVLLATVGAFLIGLSGGDRTVDEAMLPWQVKVVEGGSEVFGVRPGVSTLGDMRQRLGSDLELAIIAAPGEAGTLEGYYVQATLGYIQARVILTVDAEKELISAMRERSPKSDYMESATRKIALLAADREAALNLPVRAISVIPSVNLDEAALVQRFGPPGERLVMSEKRVHLLYPERGLDIMVDGDGKELFQYVAPSRFAELRAPLVAEASAAKGG